MTDDPKELLIEEGVSACRERNSWGRILPSPTWWDLTPGQREELFDRQIDSRIIERALDPKGRSTTVKAVLARLVTR
jgi:hypothetical protein